MASEILISYVSDQSSVKGKREKERRGKEGKEKGE